MLASAYSFILSTFIGLFVAICRISKKKIIYVPATVYVEILRNVPPLVLLYWIYFGLPTLYVMWSPFVCGVVGLSIFHSAYLSEIFRAGIQSISKKQIEAGKALGMSWKLVMKLIVLPQALVNVMPPVTNDFVLLVKDTSLLYAISVKEVLMVGKIISERSAATFEVFFAIAIIYLGITSFVSLILRYIERKLKIMY